VPQKVQSPLERVLSGADLPPALADLSDAPEVLHVRGELPRGAAVAIVGTRHPTPDAYGYTRQLAGELAAAGATIVSGGAKGIDTAAHLGALDVGGPTVVVAPAGFERPYPPENAELFCRVVESGGAYLTAEAADEPAGLAKFFRRNAILAALAHALVVTEAPLRSGARNAAATARRIGRALFVIPAVPWNTKGQGNVVELQRGARALFSHRDVLRWLEGCRIHAIPLPADRRARIVRLQADDEGSAPTASPERPAEAVPLDPEAAALVDAVRAGAVHPTEICDRTGMSPAKVQQLVLTLTLDQVLASDRAGRLRLADDRPPHD
jgi:DNA processing protein